MIIFFFFVFFFILPGASARFQAMASPITFIQSSLSLQVPYLQKINGILPKRSFPSASHITPLLLRGYENHESLLHGQLTVVSSGHTIGICLLVASYALMPMRRRHLRRQFRHPDRVRVLCPTHASTSSDLWP